VHITQIYTYPVKSMRAIQHQSLEATNFGFPYDRYWMLIDEHNQFISQRKIPELALFSPTFQQNTLLVTYNNDRIEIPLERSASQRIKTVVWDDEVVALEEDPSIHYWFSQHLNQPVRLVRKASFPQRSVKNHAETYVNFADGSQYLIIGEETLQDLNSKLTQPIAMSQFRPNLVFSDGDAYGEDYWKNITVGSAHFEATKLCSRCTMININQDTAKIDVEPLRVLSTFRKRDNKVYFGQFLKLKSKEAIRIAVGDPIRVERKA
jgi:uncharacterized protein YcbX